MKKTDISKQQHKRVGIWIRVSTEEQAQGDSPQHHEQRARYYAESKDWQVIEVYRLEGVSGKSVLEHPETNRMKKDIQRGHISALIFSKLARLGRNTKELLEFAEFFQECDADLVSLQESIDTSTPAGRLFYTMIAAMAHWEREEIASRVAASVPIRAKMGKSLGGPAPFGYQWKDKKLIPNPEESPVRCLIHELFLEHKRYKTVAKLLNEAGHRTRKGKPFSANAIQFMLCDSTSKGLHRANYVTWDGQNKKWKQKPESEWIYQEVEPILKAELWDACEAIIKEREAKRKPRAKKTVHLFSGLLFCGCGQKMYVPSNMPKYVCKQCRSKIPIDDLEAIFIEQLQNYMLSPTELNSYLEAKDDNLQDKEALLNKVLCEEKHLRSEMDKVYQLYINDKITVDGFGERYKPMEDQLGQLREEIPKLEAEVDFLKVNFLSSDQILTEAKNLANFWPEMNRESKRQVVENIVEKITLGRNDIQIDLFYLPVADPLDDQSKSNQNNEPPDDGSNSNGNINSDSSNNSDLQSPVDSATSTTVSSKKSIAPYFYKNMAKRRRAVEGTEILIK